MGEECHEHRLKLADHDRRISIIETIVGTPGSGGGLLARISSVDEKLDAIVAKLHDIQLSNAMQTGAVKGAGIAGKLIWGVLGSTVTGAVAWLLTRGAGS